MVSCLYFQLYVFFLLPSLSILLRAYSRSVKLSFCSTQAPVMHFSRAALPLALLTSTAVAVPHGNRLKRQSRPDNHTLNRERADAVRDAFTYAWNGYQKYAFPNDELHPISNSYSNSKCVKLIIWVDLVR